MSKQIEDVMWLMDALSKDCIAYGIAKMAGSESAREQIASDVRKCRASVEAKLHELLPEGFVLVPVLPTEAMLKAAVMNAEGDAVYKSLEERWLKEEEQKYGDVYCAMLSAAPKAPE